MNLNDRYRRQRAIPELGDMAQGKWQTAHVAIVGVGGLGCGVAMALASAGVGKLTLIDGDVVDFSNLHRQWLFDASQVGLPKVVAAQQALKKLQPEVELNLIHDWISSAHINQLLTNKVDIVVDACDQVEAKLLMDDCLKKTEVPWVFAAAEQWEGRLSTLNYPNENGQKFNLQDFYNDKVKGYMLGSCQERGILGPVVQTVAMIQSIEVLRILAGLSPNYIGKMWIWDAGQGTFLSPILKTNDV